MKKLKRLLNKIKRRPAFLTAGLLLALIISACAPIKPAPVQSQKEAELLVDRLRQKQNLIRTFAGKGAITFNNPERRHYFEAMVLAERPGRLRLQAFDALGRPALTLTVNDEEINYLDYRAPKLYRGKATYENLSRIMPLGLNVSELITLLAGGQPLSLYERASLEKTTELGQDILLLSLQRPGGRYIEKMWLDKDLKVKRMIVDEKGASEAFKLKYDKYNLVDEHYAPYHIHVMETAGKNELTINYDEVRINADLPSSSFTIKVPPGMTPEPLSGLTDGGV